MDTLKHKAFTQKMALTIIYLFLTFSFAWAKEKRLDSSISGNSITPSAILSITDNETYSYFYTQRSESFVELKIDDMAGPNYWYLYKATLKITPLTSVGPLTPYTVDLNIQNYRHGGLGDYIDFKSHKVAGGTAGVKVEVLGIEIWNNEYGYYESSTPDNVSLTVAYETERYFNLPNLSSYYQSGTYNSSTNLITINWHSVYEAEEYELEWTWADNYDESSISNVIAPSSIPMTENEFNKNSTRIQTKNTNYTIPSIYARGYLIYRVRTVGRHPDDYTKRLDGIWSSGNGASTLSDWNYVTITGDHENGLNWQFQASYAENGKKKEVVSYFDGSLRNRQTVTNINTANQAIIGEVIYDKEGRPAIEVLPVPAMSSILKYYRDFNLNMSDLPYSYQDLEPNDPNTPCNFLINGMSSAAGASKYYSYNNPYSDDIFNYVPDANFYPFSQTEYTHDNTGRISRKGGVGQQHQLGNGHEMKYMYSVPGQEELNRLFGYNVGLSSHYKKNVVVDPNGQVSASYIDPQGRTVATALFSDKPDQLQPLSDEENSQLHQVITLDLLNKVAQGFNDTPNDNNEKYATGNYDNLDDGLRYDAHKALISQGSNYEFTYSLEKSPPFPYACASNTYYYPTIYNLEIDITDECGFPIYKFPEEENPLQLGSYTVDGSGLVQLQNPSTTLLFTLPSSDFTISPPVGTYGISKKLVVDKKSLDLFTDDYIKRGLIDGCIFPPQSPNVDLSDCFYTCQECVNYYENTIGQSNYINQMLASNSTLSEQTPGGQEYYDLLNLLTTRYQREYELIIEACKKPCEGDGYVINDRGADVPLSMVCDNSLNVLIADVMPSGQYGLYPKTVDSQGNVMQNTATPDVASLPMSVYNENNLIYTFVKGTDPAHQNWRYPHFFDADNIIPVGSPNSAYKHYFTEFGEIDYVEIIKNEDNTYSPQVLTTATPILVENNIYKIEPQYLASVTDFINLIASRPHWARSLVKYHPEFHYLDYVYTQCGLVNITTLGDGYNTPISFNSDGFDSFIGSLTTYNEARTAGLFNDPLSLFNLDPYFQLMHPLDGMRVNVTTGSGPDGVEVIPPVNCDCNGSTTIDRNCPGESLQLKRSVMEQSLTLGSDTEDEAPILPFNAGCGNGGPFLNDPGKYMGYEASYERSMFMVIYENLRCNGLDFSCDLPANADFSTIMNKVSTDFSPEDQDKFWQYYVSYYLGIKQKLQHVFSNLYAYRQGAYNDCIGQNSENKNRIRNVISNYRAEYGHLDSMITGAPSHTLYTENKAFLQDKEKRFLPHDEQYDSGSEDQSGMLADVNAMQYQETGTCPMIRDMEIFLDRLAKHSGYQSLFAGNSVYPQPVINFLTPALFQALGCNYSAATPSVNTYEISSSLPNSTRLDINFSQSGNYNSEAVTIILDGSYGLTWNSYGSDWTITSVSHVTSQGYSASAQLYTFFALATIQRVGYTEPVDMVLKGTTKASLNCSSDPGSTYANDPNNGNVQIVGGDSGLTCNRKEKFTAALQDLIISLQQNGTINSTSGIDLLANPVYTSGFLPEYFGAENAGAVKWTYYSGVQDYEIRIGTSSTTLFPRLRLHVNLSSPLQYFSIGQLTSVYNYAAHEVTAVTDGGIFTGFINNSNTELNFSCCAPGNPNALAIDNYFELSKELYNEIIDYVVYCHNNNIPLVQNYESPLVEALSHYYANESNFGVYGLSYNIGNLGPGIHGEIQFQHGSNELENANCIDPVWIKFNVDFTQIPVKINKIVNYDYIVDAQEDISTGVFEYFDAILTNGYTSIQTIARISCLKTLTILPACPCIPQPINPVAGDAMYDLYLNHLSGFGLTNYYTSVGNTDLATFKGLNLQYITQGYLNYLSMLGITSVNNPQYISLGAFGGSALNYGYNDYTTVIYAFASQVHVQGGITDWVSFVDFYLASHPEICPPKPMIPTIDITVSVDSPCQEFDLSVAETYNADAYEAYIKSKKEAFRKAYLKDALANVSENFTMKYYDKEYQYTLYYYDQAGNLIQTVAPEGVNRINNPDPANNNWINNYRANNPDADNTALLPQHAFKTEYKYNSLNQLISQITPDGGTTLFAYDALGRIVASQNTKQKKDGKFSYTRYDNLGRITEAGETNSHISASINGVGRLVNGSSLVAVDAVASNYPYNISPTCFEVTRTLYDDYHDFNPDNFLTPVDVRNTRNRVAVILTLDSSTGPGDEYTYSTAIFYNYDIHGNVNEMTQALSSNILVGYGSTPFLARTNYEYDLISGNVNRVTYQKGQSDQFIHKYTYDADNRIVSAVTSQDGVIWEKDASYEYYLHGPLSRTVLGDKKVQGIDYAYTIQGWLKTVNSDQLIRPEQEIGKDGHDASRDAYAYSLNYFESDYKPIRASNGELFRNQDHYGFTGRNLYNGNINSMYIHQMDVQQAIKPAIANVYAYDQLNRIKEMQAHKLYDDGGSYTDVHSSRYTYDRNGNIQTNVTTANSQDYGLTKMDNMKYYYEPGTNRLSFIDDAVNSNIFTEDVDSQQSNNYTYDEIGQLVNDDAEGLGIEWRVDGKVKSVHKYTTNTGYNFYYNGLGQRVAKSSTNEEGTTTATVYGLDAQGNPLGVYFYDQRKLVLEEHHIYGSSRIGIQKYDKSYDPDSTYSRTIGDKRYELNNHLGNVLSVVSDRKVIENDEMTADVLGTNDYYPFGMLVPDAENTSTSDYRYGFQGQEKDDELKGEGNSLNYTFRMHDPRIGRFFSIDPLTKNYPFYSPYVFSGNRVIDAMELEGLEPLVATDYRTVNQLKEDMNITYNIRTVNSKTVHDVTVSQQFHYVYLQHTLSEDGGPTNQYLKDNQYKYAFGHPINALSLRKINNMSYKINNNQKMAFGSMGDEMLSHLKTGQNRGTLDNTFLHVNGQALITTLFGRDVANMAGDIHERDQTSLMTGKFPKGIVDATIDNYSDLINNQWGQRWGEAIAKDLDISKNTKWTTELTSKYLNALQTKYSQSMGLKFDKTFSENDEFVKNYTKFINGNK